VYKSVYNIIASTQCLYCSYRYTATMMEAPAKAKQPPLHPQFEQRIHLTQGLIKNLTGLDKDQVVELYRTGKNENGYGNVVSETKLDMCRSELIKRKQ
jgi:hypothetical protein